MEQEKLSREEMLHTYRSDVEKLAQYIAWLESGRGEKTASIYSNDEMEGHTIGFPVYDSKLLQFIKTAKSTKMIDKNYVYIYSRYGIRTEADELRAIERATFKEMSLLTGILSRYVIKGMTKGTVWQAGVENGVLLAVVLKMKEIMEFWDKPLA